MSSQFIQALKRVDPTEAFITYVQTVKPYHTKILDVSIEYVWNDNIEVDICEKHTIDKHFFTDDVLTTYDCGFEIVWDLPSYFSTTLFQIVGVITGTPGTASWFIDGNHAISFAPGSLIVVGKNVGNANGFYTITNAVNVGPQTRLDVQEAIISTAAPHGSIYRFDISYDLILDSSTSINSITISGNQKEKYFHGSYILIENSYLGQNDGRYLVQASIFDGTNTILYLAEPLTGSKPILQTYDGRIRLIRPTDVDPQAPHCRLGTANALFTDVFIGETITFDFSVDVSDSIESDISENEPLGYGVLPYGNLYGVAPLGLPGTTPDNESLILPTGFDTQFFDTGGLDETLQTVITLHNLQDI
jgi:hypothetical protein